METQTEPQAQSMQTLACMDVVGEKLNEVSNPGTDYRPGSWRRPFLRHLAKDGNVTRACQHAGISLQYAFRCRRKSSRFAEAWARALQEARRRKIDLCEREAVHRAVHGRKEPVYQGGQLVGYRRKRSDTLLVKVLEAEHPRKWGRKSEGSGGGSTTVNVAVQLGMLSDPVAVRLACELDARLAQGAEPQGLPAPEGG